MMGRPRDLLQGLVPSCVPTLKAIGACTEYIKLFYSHVCYKICIICVLKPLQFDIVLGEIA